MDLKKRKRLEAAGWTVSDAAAFLKPTPEESALVGNDHYSKTDNVLLPALLTEGYKARRLACLISKHPARPRRFNSPDE